MSDRIAYFDCFSGASGDMLLGSLLDAGLNFEQLKADLERLNLSGYELEMTRQLRHGIRGIKFDVHVEGNERPARNLQAVQEIIGESDLPAEVIEQSLQVFRNLAGAEAKIHGMSVDEVHFHEVGAVDTLVDIVGFCCAVHRLGIEKLYASALRVGKGTVRIEHGLVPVPAPATLALLASADAPVVSSEGEGEMVTPTGAALLTTLATFSQPPMRVQDVGYGFGTKEFPWANVVRIWIGETIEESEIPLNHEHHHVHGDSHEHTHGHVHGDDEIGHDHVHEHDTSAHDRHSHSLHAHEHGQEKLENDR
ncbi:MAG: nickel pincer cofactor biosynthesis protein LarC [Anaerolineales bacterium]